MTEVTFVKEPKPREFKTRWLGVPFFFSQPSKLECSTVGIRISQPNFQDLPAYFRENGAVPTFMAEWRRNPGGDGHEIGQSA